MSFASEKLHKGYLRKNMPHIVSKVKVREIIVHLPCLTDHDRETIEAKRETNGNFDGMVLLLECLKRRENWPEQLIEALEACEQTTIAAEIRAEYNALRGLNNTNPSSPSATVVSAHVHPQPSELPDPDVGHKGPVSVTPLAEASKPPLAPTEKLQPPQAAQSPAAQSPSVSLPEPVPETPESTEMEMAPLPSTPPPSPETQHATNRTPGPPHQEPEENSESDIQDITGVFPDQDKAENREVNSVETPPPTGPVKQSENDTVPRSESPQTTVTERPPHSNVNDGSSLSTLTPEKLPVQDTAHPEEKLPALVLEPEETTKPHTAQVVDSNHRTDAAARASPPPAATLVEASLFNDTIMCLSKPGQLVSIQPQKDGSPTIPETISMVAPYSGNSDRLEISDGAEDAVTSACVPSCPDVTSNVSNTVSEVPCQENGITLSHNEPEENHYESPSPSVEIQEVREHVLHVSEGVSILNLEGQTPAQDQRSSSETAKEIPPASTFSSTMSHTVTTLNARSSENNHPCDLAPAKSSSQLPDPVNNKTFCNLTNNTRYIVTAAAVGAVALLVAWKLKN